MLSEEESHSLEISPDENSSATKNCNARCEKSISTNEICKQGNSVTKLKPFLGLFYLFSHAIFLQSTAVIIKKVSYISTCQHALVRYAGMFTCIMPIVIFCSKETLGDKRHRFLIIIRGLLAANGLFFQLLAFRYLDLIVATIIMATIPSVTAFAARILLKEPLGLVQAISLGTTICGVILSLRLPEALSEKTQTDFDISFIIGITAAIACVLCLSLSTVLLRRLKEAHFSIIMLYMSSIGLIENSILNGTVFPLVGIKCGWDQVLCLLVGLFGACSQGVLTLATQVEPAGLVAVHSCSYDLLVTTSFQILFFSKYPDVYDISGAGLVLISLTFIGVKNWILTLPETSSKRQRLKWFLL